MATFEEQLNNLLERTHSIKSPINAAAIGTDINEYNRPSEVWINDVEIFGCLQKSCWMFGEYQ